jgi:hypothetical protein
MNQFTFATDADTIGDVIVTAAINGLDCIIVSVLFGDVTIDPATVDLDGCTLEAVLVERAEDLAADKGLFDEDAYVPERKHWEVREDRFGY